jgi:crossover junction endodeoxyribonuclease RuvC
VGIDPGSRNVGYAAIVATVARPVHPSHFRLTHAGVLRCSAKETLLARIGQLHQAMHELLHEIQPSVCVLESSFMGINPRSALMLGQARGALIASCARHSVPIHELTPSEVKKTITGKGNADKEQVALSLRHLLAFERQGLSYDVSDALAIALSWGLHHSTLR